MSSYGGVSVELQPHKQRETVPIGLVELSPYRAPSFGFLGRVPQGRHGRDYSERHRYGRLEGGPSAVPKESTQLTANGFLPAARAVLVLIQLVNRDLLPTVLAEVPQDALLSVAVTVVALRTADLVTCGTREAPGHTRVATWAGDRSLGDGGRQSFGRGRMELRHLNWSLGGESNS